jgi:hypothetical protein
LLASSNPGDLVAEFFCGSGTFPLIAARHGRRFLACDVTWRAIHTTRSRLVGSEQKPFSIHRDAASPIPFSLSNLSLITSGLTISLRNPPALDYWEIDPAWDGKTFYSAMQAQRPNRSGQISLEIKLPAAPTNVCVRATTIEGKQIQLNV